jgi:subtilisin family serine protease
MRAIALAWLLLFLALGGGPALSATPGADATRQSRPGHPLILVTFANAPSRVPSRAGTTGQHYAGAGGYSIAQSAHRQAQRVAAAYSLKEVANWPIRSLSVHCVVYEVPDNRPVATVLAALASDPQITLAQPLQEFHTLTESQPQYNDPLYDMQTNLTVLDVARAHAYSQGEGVRIGLIDTGVDTTHPDLRGRISGNHSFVSEDGTNADSYRHGTAMAGLIAATANNGIGIVGIAPRSQIEVFEACWQLRPEADAAACNTFTLAQALSAALDAKVPLINLSLGGPSDPLLSALVQAGLKRGVIFVGAATDSPTAFPTGIPGVISVGSNEHDLAGRAILTAPGARVMTLRPNAQYDFESGTSVAAAEVTGVVALVLANSPRMTATSIESLLRHTAIRPFSDQTPPPQAVDAAAAVNADAALVKLSEESGRRVASRAAAH